MTAYIFQRLMQSFMVMIIATVMVFFAVRFLPGDPIQIYMAKAQIDESSPEQLATIKAEYGLDKPVVVQYVKWLGDSFRLDFGKSVFYRQKVSEVLAVTLPVTMYLGCLAFILSAVIGIPIGIVCAVRRGGYLDAFLTVLANMGLTAPTFWLGILMIYFFGLKLGWLPIHGYTSPFDDFWLSLRKVIMPVFCLSLFSTASTARQTRSSMLEVIRQDFVRTAWAKGLSERVILLRHVLKNGLIPIITLKGVHVRLIFGGQVLIESVFNIPGMGRLAVDALFNRDYAIIQGVALVTALVVTISSLLVDVAYGWVDPRIRYEKEF